MRILAIRGENLASLRQFEVDLDDADGLGAVGLFAITGPTGAGKSTLLDALCLALYDKTPRFDSKTNGHRVGRDPDDPTNLGAADVRNILRRGAGAGFAEVDFVGRDGGHYRSRWLVHRARNRPGNRMQTQTMQLTDLLDGQPLGGATKSETLGVIEDLTGLSFDQFRRSVLLAQGDFDAFLRARVKDRGALLERMTGTDIYGRLSMAAHVRYAEAKAVVQRLQDQLAAHPVLSAGPRARLVAQVASAEAWAEAARAREAEASAAVRWCERHAALDAAVTSAKATLAAARRTNADADDARATLARVRKARPLAPLVQACAQADAKAERRASEARTATEASEQAAADATRRTADLTAARAAQQAARAAHAAAKPHLHAARALDAEITAAASACAQAATDAQRAQADAQTHADTFASLKADRAQAQIEADAAATALAQRADLGALLPRWAELRAGATRWRAAQAEVDAGQAKIDTAKQAADAVSTRLAEARAERDAAQAALTEAETAVADADAALESVDADRARAARQRHADAARHLEQLRDLADQAARQRAALTDADARITQARSRRTPLRGALTKAEKRAREIGAALSLARKSLDLSRAASAVAEHRAHLVPGDPCPVCGSTTHPGIDPALIATSEFQSQVDALAADLDAADTRAEEARVALAGINATLESEARALTRLEADERALLDSWSMLRMQAGGAVPERPDADAAATVKEQLAQARAARDAAGKQADAANAHLAQQAAARKTRAHAQGRVRGARDAVDVTAQALQQRQETLTALRQTHAEAVAIASQADGTISPLIAYIGRAAFTADPAGALEQVDTEADAYRDQQRAQAAAMARLAVSEPRWSSAQADASAARAQQARAEALHTQAEARWTALRTQRDAVLDGEPTDVVATRLDDAVQATEAEVDRAQTAVAGADQAVAHAQATAKAAAEALEDALAAQTAAREGLAQACVDAQIDVDEIAALTQHDAGWIDAEAKRLAALAAAVTQADAVHGERARDLAAHAAGPDAGGELASAQAALRDASNQRRAVERVQAAADTRLDADDAARSTRAAAEAAQIEAEAERQLWGLLDELIGSADGAAFRGFAQSLTLDAVIARANHHLKTLARRYALMRVPGENLALQVIDRHMGDEVRTIKSLSGGETFLVSLSLALGLASLSARDTRIESLFIDEGFGTLDTDTLDVVLDALDALQADGRQIGLISHVPGLAQRIGVQVLVEPTASGLSAVTVSAGWRG